MLLALLSAATIGVAAFMIYYLRGVPEGPSCPRCGTIVDAIDAMPASRFGPLDRLTDAGRCGGCGWTGRYRPGPRPELVRTNARDWEDRT
jgi:hypothetical protein